jgi:FkbM family methyltransferase
MNRPARRFRVRPSAAASVIEGIVRHPANRSRRVRALAHAAGSEVRARVTGKPVVTPIGSHSRMLAYLHRGGSWRAVRANPPDWPEMTAWRRRLGAGDLFVDIGAHAGVYTLWALDLGATVVAVEPEPEMVQQLRANLALNGYDAEVHAVACSDHAGRMRLGGKDLLRRHLLVGADAEDGAGVEVEVGTLDALLGERHARGVKIDVEGAERLVLAGATRALGDGRIDLLQLEWNDCSATLLGEDRGPVAALLRKHGYTLFRPDDRGELHPVAEPEVGRDVFAVRPEASID